MKKRNTIAVIIVLFVCVAVYLNVNTAGVESDEIRLLENFGEESALIESTETTEKNATDGEEKTDVPKYFEEARLEKQKARDTAITTLKEAIGEEGISQTTRDNAAESIETISTSALSETRIETLVKAKGFSDCIALINDSGVSVIVPTSAEGLSPEDATRIKDITVSETNISPGKIKIIEIK